MTRLALLLILLPCTALANGRFGVDVGIGAGGASSDNVSAAALDPTLHLDLGVQANPRLAIYLHAELGSLIVMNQVGLFGMAEWTPRRALSVAAGAGFAGLVDLWPDSNPGSTLKNDWAAVAVPVAVSYNFGHAERHGSRLTLEGIGGYEPSSQTFGFLGSVTFGWFWK